MFPQVTAESRLLLRKRRRPALSCAECRRRKIKCDRNNPCSHCKRSPGTTCVYKDLQPAIESRRSSSSNLSTISTASQHLQTQEQGRLNSAATSSLNHKGNEFSPSDSASRTAPDAVDGAYSERQWNSTTSSTVDDTIGEQEAPTSLDQNQLAVKGLPKTLAATCNEEICEGTAEKCFSAFDNVIIQDGNGQGKLLTKFTNQAGQAPLRGSMYRMRFFGRSHWKHSFLQLNKIWYEDKSYMPANFRHLLETCKTISRKGKAKVKAKAGHPSPFDMNPSFKDYFPPREVADKLVQNYFRTMECTHRILHIPSFHREYQDYWSDPQRAPISSIMKILLVMAIGTCFYQEQDYNSLRDRAQQWVYSAQLWVSAPFDKGRLNLSGIQVECLLLLSRQTNAVGGDLTWISAGSLLRTAFQMGFHRDPKYFPKMSIMHGELRRRLWATVLEIIIQTSLDSGMPPLITINDFDTAPPANINDEDISEGTLVAPTPKPSNVFTQTSIQIQLLKSVHTRHQISHQINDFHSELSYDDILRLGAEIAATCKEITLLMNEYSPTLPRPTSLQRNLLNIFIRRFLLILHRPFAIKSQTDPRYYFSRKVLLDTAIMIISYPSFSTGEPPPPPGQMDDYTRLKSIAGSIYKDIILFAGTIVCLELTLQLEEECASGLPPSASAKIARVPLYQCLEDVRTIFVTRIELGDNDVKGFIVVRAAMAQIDALEKGTDPEKEIAEAVRLSVQQCWELLKARMKLLEMPSDTIGFHDMGGELVGDVEMPVEEFSYDLMMQDESINLNFDLPDSWLFSDWETNNEW